MTTGFFEVNTSGIDKDLDPVVEVDTYIIFTYLGMKIFIKSILRSG